MHRPRPVCHVFQPTGAIFEFVQDIIGTNLLTKFYEDQTINAASNVKNAPPADAHISLGQIFLSRLTRKNAPPPGGHVFQPIRTIFELFHEDRTITVAPIVLTRKNAPPPGGHVFQVTRTIVELFHDDRTINVASRVLTRKNDPPLHHFQTRSRYYWDNILTKFHEDRTINVDSVVLTRKNAPPIGSHVFQANETIFKLFQDIIKTNLLTKFHEDWTINVASRHDARRTKGDHKSAP
ncbi:hypothetical protein DPMN_034328 [Dreissena polymorpha]|uniref:Uncharacterized protein n=1 Tax=Dreissena polymorpha TaxID=45954 RepID=A0A9D4M8F1_DREPO|nr:hypothetical protein DPMN_034328 [Dreissena polymorpha]